MILPKELKFANSNTNPIIHVDDDDVLLDLVKVYHSRSSLENPYRSFLSGHSFLDHLQEIKEGSQPLPLIVLLDINMPGLNGFEVLQKMRNDEFFADVPVCSMLSSSSFSEDINKSLELGADSYIVKPNNAKEFLEFFNAVAELTTK